VQLIGRSVQLASQAPDASANALIGTYDVSEPPGATTSVLRVVGPYIAASSSGAGSSGDGAEQIGVNVIPDCSQLAVLDLPVQSYFLELAKSGSTGMTSEERIAAPLGRVNWGDAIRRECWRRLAAESLTAERIVPVVDRAAGIIRLDIALRSRFPAHVSVRALDIADVDTLEDADSGVIAPGGLKVVAQRLKVDDCSSPTLPLAPRSTFSPKLATPSLSVAWSIGPAGKDPETITTTRLSPAQLAEITTAVQRLCAPPAGTSVRVVTAHLVGPATSRSDRGGIAIALRLAVASMSDRLLLGADQSGLTADARPALTEDRVRLVNGHATADLIWQVSCRDASALPLRLPLRLADGQRFEVPLVDQRVSSAYTRACSRLER
jgi:hypothetical protein